VTGRLSYLHISPAYANNSFETSTKRKALEEQFMKATGIVRRIDD
jgi:hypothetical protein